MCFGKKPKLKEPKLQTPKITPAAPIEDQTPKVVDGGDQADAARAKRRKSNPNSSLSMFQIQLLPGVATAGVSPSADDFSGGAASL